MRSPGKGVSVHISTFDFVKGIMLGGVKEQAAP
jgi:hypothetical protein